jgi:hypothetical protein
VVVDVMPERGFVMEWDWVGCRSPLRPRKGRVSLFGASGRRSVTSCLEFGITPVQGHQAVLRFLLARSSPILDDGERVSLEVEVPSPKGVDDRRWSPTLMYSVMPAGWNEFFIHFGVGRVRALSSLSR